MQIPEAPAAAAELTQTESSSGDSGQADDLPETEEGREIYAYLRQNGDTYADDIAAALDMDLSSLLVALTELELDGFVESLFGKQYRACER